MTTSKCDFLNLLWPTCRTFFSGREPWALKQSTHFSIFERFEILHLPDLLVPLAPPSPSLTIFYVFSVCFALTYSFLLYVRGVRASSTRVCRSAQFNRALPIAAQCLSFGAPPSHIFRSSHRSTKHYLDLFLKMVGVDLSPPERSAPGVVGRSVVGLSA